MRRASAAAPFCPCPASSASDDKYNSISFLTCGPPACAIFWLPFQSLQTTCSGNL